MIWEWESEWESDIRAMARRVTEWHKKAFLGSIVERATLKVGEEVGEFQAAVLASVSGNEHPERIENVGEEAADVIITTLNVIERFFPEIDLPYEFHKKMTKNERKWQPA